MSFDDTSPGAGTSIAALVLAIVGVILALLGFGASFSMILGYVSFASWAFFLIALILAIVALVRRTRGTGTSIAAIVIAVVGGVIALLSAFAVVTTIVVNHAVRVTEDFNQLIPGRGDSDIPGLTIRDNLPPDIAADCETVVNIDWPAATSVDGYLDHLEAALITDEVREPVAVLSAVYAELEELTGGTDITELSPEDYARIGTRLLSVTTDITSATTSLSETCGIDLRLPTF
ncbi:DUF5336 domain-containing protein [Microbacterium amylolyticum]|uniref:DUF4190 domain-containing protein n=1 Tax=Microbacterium amylolyticum TaxID=936337 RepID=A0ABS4ZK10_9MICO|nr:DUF5336 domain-containing protein [Microbacterium amylolyticum]MBP2437537.1 hypothetical protein [Microbacterium amylolyticum]